MFRPKASVSRESLIRELSQLPAEENFSGWKQLHPITDDFINELIVTVRRQVDALDFEPASRLADWCVLFAHELGDPVMTARALVTKGIVLCRVNDHAIALTYFDDGLALYEKAGDEFFAAKVRMNRIVSYCHLSRYDEALRDATAAGEVFERLGQKYFQAMTCMNLGEIFFRLDRWQDWRAALERAESLLQDIGDQKALAIVYMNRAVVCTSQNDPSNAYRYYRMSREMSEQTGQVWLAAVCNYNLGYLHYLQGEYTKALDTLNATREAFLGDRWYVPLCDLTQSEICLEMNMYGEAIRFAESARAGFEANQKPFETAKAIAVIAIAQSQLHNVDHAAELFDCARAMFLEQGNAPRAAGIDVYRGLMWLGLGRYADARQAAHEAHEAFMKEGLRPKAVFALIVAARASLKLLDVDAASRDAASATSIHESSPAPWVGQQLHSIRGEICLARGDTQQARDEFRRAIDQLEGVRANIAPDDLRLNFLKDKVPIYEMLVNCYLELGDPASLREAFLTAERAKSRTLVDLLAGSVESLKEVTSASIEQIQATLAPGAALIEYFMSGDRVMAFCISPDGFEVALDLCSPSEVTRRFEFLRFHFSRLAAHPAEAKSRPALALANVQDHFQKLYEMLVRPLEPFLAGRESIVFVPFDFMHYVPLHALFDGSRYLIDRFTISYAPTATVYQLFEAKHADGTCSMPLLVGVPDEAAPFIADEIESIQSVLPGARALIGSQATQANITREMETASMIHIASHATFRPDNPMFSSIQLHDVALNFFDIYTLRTPARLITLSGCGTGLSSVVAGDELLGLVRGFLYAGATSLVTSLWDVSDYTTGDLMKHFYGYLAEGNSKSQSLRKAMVRLREEHPHPYYWAPFLLMGDPN